jgi:hypothetical protein
MSQPRLSSLKPLASAVHLGDNRSVLMNRAGWIRLWAVLFPPESVNAPPIDRGHELDRGIEEIGRKSNLWAAVEKK